MVTAVASPELISSLRTAAEQSCFLAFATLAFSAASCCKDFDVFPGQCSSVACVCSMLDLVTVLEMSAHHIITCLQIIVQSLISASYPSLWF